MFVWFQEGFIFGRGESNFSYLSRDLKIVWTKAWRFSCSFSSFWYHHFLSFYHHHPFSSPFSFYINLCLWIRFHTCISKIIHQRCMTICCYVECLEIFLEGFHPIFLPFHLSLLINIRTLQFDLFWFILQTDIKWSWCVSNSVVFKKESVGCAKSPSSSASAAL